MNSKTTLDVIRTGVTLSGPVFHLIPLSFRGLRKVVTIPTTQRIRYIHTIWCILQLVSLSLSLTETLWSVWKVEDDATAVVFHFFLLISKFGSAFYLITFQRNSDIIALILNTIITNSLKFRNPKAHSGKLFPTILVSITASTVLLIVTVPLTSQLYYKHLHTLHIEVVGYATVESFLWRIFVFLVDFTRLVPMASIVTVTGPMALVVLDYMQTMLRSINILLRKLDGFDSRKTYVLILYREMELFNQLCNQAFQLYIWAVVQSTGAAVLIACLYCLTVNHKRLGLLLLVGTTLVAMIAAIFNALVFHVGSKPGKLSTKILHYVKTSGRSDSWERRFARSFRVLAVRVGEFHKMDRKRGPDFFRFVLQRTSFLVAKIGD